MNTSELIEKSQKVIIVLTSQATPKDSQKARALACGLKKLGKEVSIEKQNLLEQKNSSIPLKKTFVVSLKGLAPWISRVYYEKSEKDLKLYFTLAQGEILPKDLSLQTHTQSDLIIIVGNKGGRHNSLTKDPYQLKEQEAKQAIQTILLSSQDATTRLLGVVLFQLQYTEKFSTYLTSFKGTDFQDSQTNPKNIIGTIEHLVQHLNQKASYLILYSTEVNCNQAVLYSSQQGTADIIPHEKKEQRGNWTIFSISPDNLQDITRTFSPVAQSHENDHSETQQFHTGSVLEERKYA